jgi:hypothetical protein
LAVGGAAGAGLGYLAGKGLESADVLSGDLKKTLTPEMMAAMGGALGGGLGSVGGGYAGSRAATQKYIPEDSKFASVLDREKVAFTLLELMAASGLVGLGGIAGAANQLKGDEGLVAQGLNMAGGVTGGITGGVTGGVTGGTLGSLLGTALERRLPGASEIGTGLGALAGAGLGGYAAGAAAGKMLNYANPNS